MQINGIENRNSTDTLIAKIGMVRYINVAPIHETWKRTVCEKSWQIIEAAPSLLNKMLAQGEIDLGFVSSFEYGNHPGQYRILPDLSISANGHVGSVFLFSKIPIEQLDNAHILLSSQSETSVCLVKIILENFYDLKPSYKSGDIFDNRCENCQAVLAIGDDALRLVENRSYPYSYDLGDIWKQKTGLPFVFSVCAVRNQFYQEQRKTLASIHKELIRCRDQGKRKLRTICEWSAPRIPMSEEKCYQYLTAIEYDLCNEKQKALTTFFSYLINRGEISSSALPLVLADNLS